jgi:predicted ATPase/class 3 adenylate cyclase
MDCPSCGAEVPSGNRYCGVCGAEQDVTCPGCGHRNPPAAKFCGACFAGLVAMPQAVARDEAGAALAERRHLTVMFCDLVDSTELSGRFDPEDLDRVIHAYQASCLAHVRRFEGTVARFIGDGILVFFGYPQAHEDDPERAVRAALKIAAGIGKAAPLGVELRVRVGIATGLVLIRDVIGKNAVSELEAIGSTPSLAARLQALAAPNTIIIAESSRRLLGGLFECVDLGRHALPGISEPVQAWRVVVESPAGTRFEALRGEGLTPLVGREAEIALLLERWDEVKSGSGRVVLLSSEAGIGKSRLIRDFRERVGDEPYRFLGFNGSPHYQDTALHPVIAELERAAGFEPDEPSREKLVKLEQLLASLQFEGGDAVALLAALLSVQAPELPPLNLSPARRKGRTLELLVAEVGALARRQPVLVQIEDVHWIDPTTLEYIGLLIAALRDWPVLLILAFRPEFKPAWAESAAVTRLSLARLDRQHSTAMVARLTEGQALPAELLDEIVAKADGVPLFIEELTKTVLESGMFRREGGCFVAVDPLPALAVPTTLQASLTARLDRLGAAKEVAQMAAVIGRSFPYRLLAAVSPLGEAELDDSLRQLAGAELVFADGAPPESTYTFKHALVQDASYETLLRARRRSLHEAIAKALERQFPERVRNEPELLAHHYTQASLLADAIPYGLKAARRAMARSATAEAMAQLRKALNLMRKLPAGAQRDAFELELQLALGQVQIAAKGHAAGEVGEAFSRARELCGAVGEPTHLSMILMGLASYHQVRGELAAAITIAEELLHHVEQQNDPAALAMGHRGVAVAQLYLGRLAEAVSHLERGLALYDPEQRGSRAFQLVNNPRVASWSLMSGALLRLGFADQARQRSRAALAEARGLQQPFDIAGALHHACFLHRMCRDHAAVEGLAASLVELAYEQNFPNYLATGTIFHGWAIAEAGHSETGIAEMERGIDAYRAPGAEINVPCWLGMLAEGYCRAGAPVRAAPLVADALARVERTGERGYESDLLRLAGAVELALPAPDRPRAEDSFRRALQVAREQEARLWELRGAGDLARLWASEGRHDAARALLAPILGWFREGLDLPDLVAATALLAELT